MSVVPFPRATVTLDGGEIAEQLRPLLEAAVETAAGKIEAELHRLDAELGRETAPGRRRLEVRIEISELLLTVARSHANYRISFRPAGAGRPGACVGDLLLDRDGPAGEHDGGDHVA